MFSNTYKLIDQLDLDPIKVKLMDSEEGYGWSRALADTVERQYRQFLKLLASHSSESVVPTQHIDKFWHAHILDTHKYAEDCQNIFGRFIHHFPYFGMRGEQDKRNLRSASKRTHAIVAKIFGNDSWKIPALDSETASICTSCGTSDCAPTPSCGSVEHLATNVLRVHERPKLVA